ncbi:MAG: neutral zinc metallopeptidase, partial [Cyanobacteria bacterium J06553_1]
MRWKTGRRSQNVQDRRGQRGGYRGGLGGSRGGGSPMVIGGGGLGMVVFAIIITLLGGDPTILLDAAAPTG